MRYWIVSNVLLGILLIVAGQNCFKTIRTPYLKTSSGWISRDSICHHKCWFWFKKQIGTGYSNVVSCSVSYKSVKQSVCCDGFRKGPSGKCEPICNGCLNGRCTAPNECTCDKGFRNEIGSCVPVCDPECGRGTCEATGRCSCAEGYVMDPRKGCIPNCNPPCRNGECVERNTCRCFDGYRKTAEPNVCTPMCDPKIVDCANGTCVGPNRCNCAEGFIFEGNRCVPECDPPCINGTCTKPNICSCGEGSVNNLTNPAECIPFCNGGCQNGNCIAPNSCECLNGFEQSNDDPNLCEPGCDPTFVDIRHGECIAPNVVECNPGFMMGYSTVSGRIFCRKF